MSIKASVHQIDKFSSSVDSLKSDYENGVQVVLNVCDTLEKSIKNFLDGMNSIISTIDTDISNADYVYYQNESLYARYESQREYAEKRLAVVEDPEDIKNYQKKIADCDYKMNEISQKNQRLSSVISQLRTVRNKYSDALKHLPNLDSIKPIRKNLEKLKSEHWSLCSQYEDKVLSAQKLVSLIDENLSYVAEVSSSSSRIVTVHNAQSLIDMAHSLRSVSDGISNQNGGLNADISTFSSVIQDEVSNNAVSLCRESSQIVKQLIDNFDDLANHFESAARYLKQYEHLV